MDTNFETILDAVQSEKADAYTALEKIRIYVIIADLKTIEALSNKI